MHSCIIRPVRSLPLPESPMLGEMLIYFVHFDRGTGALMMYATASKVKTAAYAKDIQQA